MFSSLPPLELESELGSGATSRVVLGQLVGDFEGSPAGTKVALKRPHAKFAGDPRVEAAFRAEAEAAGVVQHESIACLLQAGVDEEGPFLLYAFVPGKTLAELLEETGPLVESELREVGAQIATGLAALHERGWVHGDVKPENVRKEDTGRAVLLDFGFARRNDAPVEGRAGSLAYLAPEQAAGDSGGPASDVFALGVTLYELATKNHPYLVGDARPSVLGAVDADRLLAALAGGHVLVPSRRVPELSPFLDHLLLALLSRDPNLRPEANEVRALLEEGEASEWWHERIRVQAAPTQSPFVGRQSVIDRMLGLAREEHGRVVWLEGAHGGGVWRTVREFARRARMSTEPPIFLSTRCNDWEEERPGQPFRSLLRQWLSLPHSTAPGPRERARLEALVPPSVAETLEAALTPAGRPAGAVVESFARWLVELGRVRRVVVALDDIGRAGAVTLDFVAKLAEELAETRVLLTLGFKRDAGVGSREVHALRERLAANANLETLAIKDLEPAEVLDYVERRFHRSTPRLRLSRILWERSRGNPGLISEILKALIARGDVSTGEDGEWRLHIAPEGLPLPRSLPRIVAERHAALPVDLQRWLGRLAVVGGRIEVPFLVEAFPPSTAAEVEAVLESLVREDWLKPRPTRFRFARPVLRQAVYKSLDPGRRRRLHAAAARALIGPKGTGLPVGDAFQRAFHLRAAEDHKALISLVRPLISVLLRRGDPQRVDSLARWGLEALDALPDSPRNSSLRVELYEAAVDATERLGKRERQRELLDRLADLELDPAERPSDVAGLYLRHARFSMSTGQYGIARGFLHNARQLARKSGERELESAVLRWLAHLFSHVGDLKKARELAEKALGLAKLPVPRAQCRLVVGVVDLLDDRFLESLRQIDRAFGNLRQEENEPTAGTRSAAYLLRARVYRQLGRPRRALGALSQATRFARQSGERWIEAEIAARVGGTLIDVGREEEAEARLRESLLLAREIEDRRGETLALLFLGTLLAEGGDPEGAAQLERSMRLARELGLNRLEALGLSMCARVAREAGDLERGLVLTQKANELCERFGAELADRIVIAGTRALLLRQSGQSSEAREIERSIERRVRRENERISAPILRQRHHRATRQLLEACASPDGPVYPRVKLRDLPGNPPI